MKLGYARLSSEMQTEGLTLQLQVERLKDAGCEEIFQDIESGWKGKRGNSADREDFQRLIARAEALRIAQVNVEIVVAELERWGRSVSVVMESIEHLESKGIKIYALDGGRLSVESASDWLSTSQRAVWAEFFSRSLSGKISRVWDSKRRDGRPMQQRKPFGWIAEENEAKLIFDRRPWKDTGKSAYAIARELIEYYVAGNSLHATCQLGQTYGLKFSVSTMGRWIRNPIQRGHTWYYKHKLAPGENRTKENNEMVVLENQHEPLINPNEWTVIQLHMDQSRAYWGANRDAKPNVLRGLCFCSECGRRLSRNTYKNEYRTMRCTYTECRAGGMSYDKIEAAIIGAICERSEAIAAALVAPEPETIMVKPAEVVALEDQLRSLKTVMRNTPVTDTGIRQGLETAIREINRRITVIMDTLYPKNRGKISSAELQDIARAVATPEVWEEIEEENRRPIYIDLVESVIIQLRNDDRRILAINLTF